MNLKANKQNMQIDVIHFDVVHIYLTSIEWLTFYAAKVDTW